MRVCKVDILAAGYYLRHCHRPILNGISCMSTLVDTSVTLLDAIERSLSDATTYNERSRVAPAAILWTDAKREWTGLLPGLRERFPHLLTLGDYDLGSKTGPAIWIKCMLARTLEEADWPASTTPIVYLPGTSRRDIRAIESCEPELKPLAELQYRGALWSQANARDWTVRAFLVSEHGGLGLDVAGDDATQTAMLRSLPEIALTPLSQLRGRYLNAASFRQLIAEDPVRDLLQWMSRPEETRDEWGLSRWKTFSEICEDEFDFEPEAGGVFEAARKLGFKEGNWARVWQRYMEAPEQFPGIKQTLRQARPPQTGDLFQREPTWPQDNEALEDDLRHALSKLSEARRDEAVERIRELENEHQDRRQWVWARLDEAPLAMALESLYELSQAVSSPLGGASPSDIAAVYVKEGWRADAAALDALNHLKRPEDIEVVHTAVRALYGPWLTHGAEALQKAVERHHLPKPSAPPTPASGTVILFADALRFDVGQALARRLEYRDYHVEKGWEWAAFPSVTATAKPAVSPIASELSEESLMDDRLEFSPQIEEDGSTIDIRRFRKLMEASGHQILEGGETGDPSGTAWTEIGNLDTFGHNEKWKIARRVEEVTNEMAERVRQLLEAGWTTVEVVTDHGWIVMPGDLPKEPLKHYLADTRWGRCAVIKESARTQRPTVPWHWNPDINIALAPGISVHKNGIGYAHGGISPQECVIPHLAVQKGEAGTSSPEIGDIEWVRLMCRVLVYGATSGLKVDVRQQPADESSSVAFSVKPVPEGGKVSIAVEDPSMEGEEVAIVLLKDDTVIDTHPTHVGRHE